MKVAVIIFHKNIDTYYKPEWIAKCYDTIRNQEYKDFDVFELDYGGTGRQTYEGSNFESIKMETHAHAHNFLLDWAFELGYDCAFNVNVDDWYALNRFNTMLPYIHQGYDVVSSNFYRVDRFEEVIQPLTFHTLNPIREANRGHNIIAHPVVCYSRNFWLNCTRLNPKEIPADDFELWKRSYKKGFRFIILPQYLLFQRVHENNISKRK
jgi:hypothetical protein